MNKAILMGRLTRDPEVKYSNALAIARFTLAVDRKFKKQGEPEADFISCVAFGKIAEHAEKFYKQGIKIAISGRLQSGSYTKGEQKVYFTEVVIEEAEFAESKGSNENSGYQSAKPSVSTNAGDGFMNIPEGLDEELPFN